jgi:hypothetical protein
VLGNVPGQSPDDNITSPTDNQPPPATGPAPATDLPESTNGSSVTNSGGLRPSVSEPDFDDFGDLADAVGDPGLPERTTGVRIASLTLDDGGDSSPKERLKKFRYDGILDGFEFQGWGLRPSGIDQDALWAALDDMERQMSGLDDSSQRSFVVSTIIGGSSLLLTTGLISWVLRGGALASALLSTLPLWRGMDPLPLLAGRKKKTESQEDLSETQILLDTQQLTETQLMDRAKETVRTRVARDAEKMFDDTDRPDSNEPEQSS